MARIAEAQFMSLLKTYTQKIRPFFDDPKIVEIMANPGGDVWIDELGSGMRPAGCKLAANEIEGLISIVASWADTTVTKESPILSSELPTGERFEGLISPVVASPVFAIRKPASLIYTFDNYVAAGIFPESLKPLFVEAVRERKNILIVGGTGSGKTTLINAFIQEIAKEASDQRIISIEDTRELQIVSPNVVSLRTSDRVDMTRLLRSCMRLRPDRIIVGEVRGPEALALLKAWNTGHPGGLATVHANDAKSGLTRLEQLLWEAGIPDHASRPIISEAINMIVSIQRTKDGRRVKDVLVVEGRDSEGDYQVRSLLSPAA